MINVQEAQLPQR